MIMILMSKIYKKVLAKKIISLNNRIYFKNQTRWKIK